MSTLVKKRLHAIGLLGLLALAALPAQASGAEAGPRWQVSSFRSFPTTLIRGSAAEGVGSDAINAIPQITAVIVNTGAGAAGEAEPIRVDATLPAGLAVAAGKLAQLTPEVPCETPTSEEILCEIERTVPSGEEFVLSIPLEVSESTPSPAVTRLQVSGGGALPVSGALTSTVGGPPPGYGFLPGPGGLFGAAGAAGGLDAGLAGSHPYDVTMEANFPTKLYGSHDVVTPVENLRDLKLHLPRGLVVDPQSQTEMCSDAELLSVNAFGNGGCPRASQIGNVAFETYQAGILPVRTGLYDMPPRPGVPAQFGFTVLTGRFHIDGGLDGNFHLTGSNADILAKYSVFGIRVELWGDPADPGHDSVRLADGGCGYTGPEPGCAIAPAEANKVPFLTMPASCTEALTLSGDTRSWEGTSASGATTFSDREGNPLQMSGCNALGFSPTIEAKATTDQGDSPSGLDFSIHQPQSEAIEGRSTAPLRDARVTLPEGMTVNPAGADGLGVCSEEEMGYAPSEGKIHFQTTPQGCPSASKLGTVEVTTPLQDHKLAGKIYLAKPYHNPFGSLLALYLAVEDEESGIVAKLAGKVEPDPQSGRLSATFTENPELPLQDIDLHFFNGANAPLQTPISCGTHTTTTTLTPWSTPEGADAHPSGAFQTTASCSADEAAAPKTVSFTAGTTSPLSGAYSPFVLRFARPDGSQRITGIETTLPEGLLGKLAGIAYCPESAISQAQSREAPERGREEQRSPSCPGSSEVGTVQVSAGAGIDPISVSGHAYLAGPYKGAPLSMVAIVPAVAGPFDLGTVVDRIALDVDPVTAQIHAVADPLPTIREGIPFDVRSISLKVERPGFTLNPTSCEAMAIEGSLDTAAGQSEPVKNRFQVGECGRLAFKPHLTLRLKGATRRAGHPKLIGTVYSKGGEADISRLQVKLPRSAFLDQAHIRTICTRVQFSAGAGNGSQCPKGSVYGHAWVKTPLLDYTLSGPVLLRSSNHKLPDLVMALSGPSYQPVQVELSGKTDSVKGALRNTFEAVPDAPFSEARLVLFGGKRGLVVNSRNLCANNYRANVSALAQSGKAAQLHPLVRNSCKKAKHKRHRGHRHRGKGRR